MVKKAVEDGGGAGDVADELASVLQRAVAAHHGGPRLVAHDDIEQDQRVCRHRAESSDNTCPYSFLSL